MINEKILDEKLTLLKGIGPKTAECFEGLGILNIRDLLFHLPYRYEEIEDNALLEDYSEISDKLYQTRCTVKKIQLKFLPGKKSMLDVQCEDFQGRGIVLRYFNQLFRKNHFKENEEVFVEGKIKVLHHRIYFTNPRKLSLDEEKRMMRPIYSLKKGVTKPLLEKILKDVFEFNIVLAPESQAVREILNIDDIFPLIRCLHFPESPDQLAEIQEKYREMNLLIFSEKAYLSRISGERETLPEFSVKKFSWMNQFLKKLPFQLTQSQVSAIEEIVDDLSSDIKMKRLLQGDVGCGKTIVCICIILCVVEAGKQVALMAPTTLLAEQHFLTLKNFLKDFSVTMEKYTGQLKSRERKIMNEKVKNGEIQVLIGTHALFSNDLEFRDLGLVVIDEQHRFGVNQREALKNKGKHANILNMTATPIPRSLAMVLYNQMDITTIAESPGIRQEVKTYLRPVSKFHEALKFACEEWKKGGQTFIVNPIIDESKRDMKNLLEIEKEVKKHLSCEIIHGKMDSEQRKEKMDSFRNKEFACLISTTVIEVGIDIADATIMLILHADQFGLSTLHQLRGRIGRGNRKGYCILMIEDEQEIPERLEKFTKVSDGFELSREDLKLRGPGLLWGTRQYGIGDAGSIDLFQDLDKFTDMMTKIRRYYENHRGR